jgi:hypothetical protein
VTLVAARAAIVLACLVFGLAACGRGDTLSTGTDGSSTEPYNPDTPVSTAVDESPGSRPPADAPPSGAPDGGATPVEPDATAQNPVQVAVQEVTVTVDGRRVTARILWWAGVAPCHVLQRVERSTEGHTIFVSVWMGTTDPTAACVEIAQQYVTEVDLGELESGSWTLRWGELPSDRVDFTV